MVGTAGVRVSGTLAATVATAPITLAPATSAASSSVRSFKGLALRLEILPFLLLVSELPLAMRVRWRRRRSVRPAVALSVYRPREAAQSRDLPCQAVCLIPQSRTCRRCLVPQLLRNLSLGVRDNRTLRLRTLLSRLASRSTRLHTRGQAHRRDHRRNARLRRMLQG